MTKKSTKTLLLDWNWGANIGKRIKKKKKKMKMKMKMKMNMNMNMNMKKQKNEKSQTPLVQSHNLRTIAIASHVPVQYACVE